MNYFEANTATEAFEHWYKVLENMKSGGLKMPSRAGIVVGEVINAITVIKDPTRGIVTSSKRNMSMRYALGELLWYLSGSNYVSDINKYSKAWDDLTDDGETINSAYGYRIKYAFGFDQWEHVLDLFEKDPYTRQAVIHIKDASNEPTKDTPCTVALQFSMRNNKLDLTVYMRSNDIWLGFPYDVFSFTALQVKMAMELGYEIGEYTHIANSLHLYERNVLQDETTEDISEGKEGQKE